MANIDDRFEDMLYHEREQKRKDKQRKAEEDKKRDEDSYNKWVKRLTFSGLIKEYITELKFFPEQEDKGGKTIISGYSRAESYKTLSLEMEINRRWEEDIHK